jgi:hypothetical protein
MGRVAPAPGWPCSHLPNAQQQPRPPSCWWPRYPTGPNAGRGIGARRAVGRGCWPTRRRQLRVLADAAGVGRGCWPTAHGVGRVLVIAAPNRCPRATQQVSQWAVGRTTELDHARCLGSLRRESAGVAAGGGVSAGRRRGAGWRCQHRDGQWGSRRRATSPAPGPSGLPGPLVRTAVIPADGGDQADDAGDGSAGSAGGGCGPCGRGGTARGDMAPGVPSEARAGCPAAARRHHGDRGGQQRPTAANSALTWTVGRVRTGAGGRGRLLAVGRAAR